MKFASFSFGHIKSSDELLIEFDNDFESIIFVGPLSVELEGEYFFGYIFFVVDVDNFLVSIILLSFDVLLFPREIDLLATI